MQAQKIFAIFFFCTVYYSRPFYSTHLPWWTVCAYTQRGQIIFSMHSICSSSSSLSSVVSVRPLHHCQHSKLSSDIGMFKISSNTTVPNILIPASQPWHHYDNSGTAMLDNRNDPKGSFITFHIRIVLKAFTKEWIVTIIFMIISIIFWLLCSLEMYWTSTHFGRQVCINSLKWM